MFTKVVLMGLMALASARPDKPAPTGYGYAPPTPSYRPPTPSYEAPRPSYSAPVPSYEKEHEKGMPFEFEYAVKDDYKGVDFNHDADSDGDVVTGEYRVLLPDGRTQIVTYTADWKNGYHAEVTYEGEAQYPEVKPYKPAPSYSAPAPSYSAPEPVYSAPVYKPPTPTYSAPAPTYKQPTSLYGPPRH